MEPLAAATSCCFLSGTPTWISLLEQKNPQALQEIKCVLDVWLKLAVELNLIIREILTDRPARWSHKSHVLMQRWNFNFCVFLSRTESLNIHRCAYAQLPGGTVPHQGLWAADVKWYPISQILWWCTSPAKSELHPSQLHKSDLTKFIKTRLSKQLDEEKRKLPSARRELPLKIQNLQLEIHLFTTRAKLKAFNTSAELHLKLLFLFMEIICLI